MNFKLEDFEVEKLNKNQQKKVRGGDDPIPVPATAATTTVDPGKGTGVGGSN